MKKFSLNRILIVASALAGACAGSVAEAHPHVWVTYNVTAMLRQGEIVALREHWVFDPMFSSMVAGDVLKRPHVAALSTADVATIKAHAFQNLQGYGYFQHLTASNKAAGFGAVSEFNASMENGKLTYTFVLPLAHPADPHHGPLKLGIWDDTYYVDMAPQAKAVVQFDGEGAQECHATAVQDKKHPIYFGLVIPTVFDIAC